MSQDADQNPFVATLVDMCDFDHDITVERWRGCAMLYVEIESGVVRNGSRIRIDGHGEFEVKGTEMLEPLGLLVPKGTGNRLALTPGTKIYGA